jgi:branched-chain amino acid transport system permease protein
MDRFAPRESMAARGPATKLPPIYGRLDYPRLGIFVVVVFLAKSTIVHGQSGQNSFNLWLLYSISALGFYLVFGVAGRFAFSQTFMMALGAYLSAWIATHHSVLFAVVASVVLATFISLVLGLMLVRANEFYFGIATLAIGGIGTIVFQSWTGFAGPSGLRYNIAPLRFNGLVVDTEAKAFWVFLAVLLVVLLTVSFVERSPLRREAIAAREAPMVARTLGIPVARIQLVMFVLGSTLAALSGALYAHWQGVISPTTFGLDLSIGIFLMAILGGLGSMWGVIIGAAFYVFVPQQLQTLSRYQNIVYGGLLLVITIVLPDGLLGVFGRMRALIRGRVYVAAATHGAESPFRRIAEAVNRARGN